MIKSIGSENFSLPYSLLLDYSTFKFTTLPYPTRTWKTTTRQGLGKSNSLCSTKGENKSRTHNLKKAKLYNRPQIPGVWPPYPSELRTFPCKVADPEHSNSTTVFLQGDEQLSFLQCDISTNSLVAPVTLTCPIPTTATISAATKSWLVLNLGGVNLCWLVKLERKFEN